MPAHDFIYETLRLLSEAVDYSEIGCPDCRGRLVVHQPDERLPERLLGTCRCCLNWFLIDAAGEIMFRLPDEDALRRAGGVSKAGCEGISATRRAGDAPEGPKGRSEDDRPVGRDPAGYPLTDRGAIDPAMAKASTRPRGRARRGGPGPSVA